MRCPPCGNSSHLPGATHCRVCGAQLPPEKARATARHGSGWRDPSQWKRHLLVRAGSAPIELKAGTEWRVGRSSECQLRIQSPRVSRVHAAILWQEGKKPVVRDLQSQNGVHVNGRQVREHALQDGDELTIGPFTATYRMVDGIGSTAELQELLDSQADTQTVETAAMSGRLQEVSLFEVLETLSFNRRTGTVEVYGPWGDEGRIGLADGQAMWAQLEQMKGRAAIDALLEWTEGMFRFTAGLDKRPVELDVPLATILEDARKRGPGPTAEDYKGPPPPGS